MAESTATTKPANSMSIVFKEPLYKPNTGSSDNSNALSSEPSSSPKPRRNSQSHSEFNQDWTTVTHDEDTWAMRERRRLSMWSKVDNYPGGTHMRRPRTISGGSRATSGSAASDEGRKDEKKKGSILSMFHDDDDHEEVPKKRRSSQSGPPRERRGSILSLFRRGKDERGRSVLSSDNSPVVDVK